MGKPHLKQVKRTKGLIYSKDSSTATEWGQSSGYSIAYAGVGGRSGLIETGPAFIGILLVFGV